MSELRWPLRVYLVAIVAAAPVALLAAAAGTRQPTPNGVVLFALLSVFAAIAQARPLKLSVKMWIGVDDVAIFAAVLLFDPFEAMVLAGGAFVVSKTLASVLFRERVEVIQHAFNAATSTLGAGAAALTFRALALGDGSVAGEPLAVAASAIALYVVRTGLVDLAVALQLRRDPIAAWWRVHKRDLPQHAALYLLGALAALSVVDHPWALALFAMPAALVFLSMRELVRLREQTRAAIYELADLVDERDPYTHGHSQRVADHAARLARKMGLRDANIELIREAARMHDVGKIGTPDRVLLKPGPFTPEEQTVMREHAEIGARMLARIPEFWEGAALVRTHHERYDGQGYPRALKATEVPLEAAIIAVADAYDAMTSDRPYRAALPWPVVRTELVRGRGTQWDAAVVDAFLELWDPRSAPASEAVTAPAR